MPRGQNKSTSKPKKEAAPETKTAQQPNNKTAEPAAADASKKGGKGKKGKGK